MEQFILNPDIKTLGFVGGKGRNYIVNEIADFFKRSGFRVAVSHLGSEMLPLFGKIVQFNEEAELFTKVKEAFKENSIIYIGKEENQGFLKGIDLTIASKLSQSELIDYNLLILGPPGEFSIIPIKYINEICEISFLDQLVYCYQIDKIGKSFDKNFILDRESFNTNFPEFAQAQTINHQLIIKYLTSKAKGIFKFFQQNWPTALVFTDVNSVILENNAINLARELFTRKIHHIFLANLRENLIKRIPEK